MVLTQMKAGGCHLHCEEISAAAMPLLPQSLTDGAVSFPPKEHVPVSLLRAVSSASLPSVPSRLLSLVIHWE